MNINNRDDNAMSASPVWKAMRLNQPDKIDNNRMNALRAVVLLLDIVDLRY